jgi:hypothetical protein
VKYLLRSVLLTVVLAAATAPAENWCQSFADDNVILGYVNVKGVRAIPALGALIDGQDRLSRMAGAARQHLAVDLETVTDVWFGVSASRGSISVLQGTYNLATIRGVASAAQNLRISTPPGAEFTVTDPSAEKPTMVAFMNPTAAVLGQPVQVEAFLANLASGNRHLRAKDLAVFAKPTHLVECVMLGVPREVRRVPPVIGENIALLALSVAGTDAAEIQLTVVPRDPAMAAPLAAWCQSSLDLLHLLPPEQLAPANEMVRALIRGTTAAPAPQGVTLSASLPLALVQGPLGRRLGSGGQAQGP